MDREYHSVEDTKQCRDYLRLPHCIHGHRVTTGIQHFRSTKDLNTVGKKSATESTSEVMKGSCSGPNQGRVRNFGTQGCHEYGRLGGPKSGRGRITLILKLCSNNDSSKLLCCPLCPINRAIHLMYKLNRRIEHTNV